MIITNYYLPSICPPISPTTCDCVRKAGAVVVVLSRNSRTSTPRCADTGDRQRSSLARRAAAVCSTVTSRGSAVLQSPGPAAHLIHTTPHLTYLAQSIKRDIEINLALHCPRLAHLLPCIPYLHGSRRPWCAIAWHWYQDLKMARWSRSRQTDCRNILHQLAE